MVNEHQMADTLKNRVKGSTNFINYHDGALWYKCDDGFEFPVPMEDIGGATFNATEKGILMMRYIRKYMAILEQAKL